MIEMDEQFQREFGAAMAQLRALHLGYTGSAENSRGEARALVAGGQEDQAVACYETSHTWWSAAERLRPILASFEDADRRAASLMVMPEPVFTEPVSAEDALTNASNVALHNRVRYLEDQLARLDTALRGRPATLDERIRETETTEDLIDAAIRAMSQDGERARADREKDRADRLGKVTTAVGHLLGVTELPAILPKLRRKLGLSEVDLYTLPEGTLVAGEWVSAAGQNRKTYVGRFLEVDSADDAPIIEYICECGEDDARRTHVVSTKLRPSTVRLPIAEEILVFDALSKDSGLLLLSDASDE